MTFAAALIAETMLSGGDMKHVEIRLREYSNVAVSQPQASTSSLTTHVRRTMIDGYSIATGRLSTQ
jgi:hypothetical protein